MVSAFSVFFGIRKGDFHKIIWCIIFNEIFLLMRKGYNKIWIANVKIFKISRWKRLSKKQCNVVGIDLRFFLAVTGTRI